MKNWIILFIFFSTVTNAQHKLLLKSGTYEIEEGTFSNLRSGASTRGIAFWDHRVVVEDKKALAQLGIELGRYLPHNAFEATVPAGTTPEQLKAAGLSSFVGWLPEMKLDGPVHSGVMPEWAVVADGQWAVQFMVGTGFDAGRYVRMVRDLTPLGGLWYSGIVKPEKVVELASDPEVHFIQAIEEPGRPENENSRASARTQYVQLHSEYDGTGVVVGVGDDGDIGPHADYKGRLTSIAGASIGDHGDHVAGTVFGAGNIDPKAKGNAPGATMYYSSYPDNLDYIDTHYNTQGVRVTNSSYSNGCNAGYTFYAQQVDEDIEDNVQLMHVFSAGNSNGTNCNYGAGSNWGNITGGHKQGKNVIATANVTATDAIAPSSSRGPAADGRIKPDVAAVGTSVYSTTDPNTYTVKTGTSMASPGAAGFIAVLHNAYDSIHNANATGAFLKAVAMNTAEDLGNSGPDFIYGYGRLNGRRALKSIENSWWFTGSVSTGDTVSFNLNIPAGTKNVRAMLYWNDPAANLSAAQALVNNLDFEVEHQSSGTAYLPWVLDPTPTSTALSTPAVRAVDSLNNAEQVTIDNPTSGDYSLRVFGSNIPSGPQSFYVVYYIESSSIVLTQPTAGQKLIPGNIFVHWDEVGLTGTPSFSWSSDGGGNWTNLSLTPFSGRNVAQWNVPNTLTSEGYMRVIQGGDTAVSGPFVVSPTPSNIQLDWACPDSIRLSFTPVSGAGSHTAYILGMKYMDSLAVTSGSTVVIPWQPVQSTWASVAANVNGKVGERAYAIEIPAGVSGCPLAVDAGLLEIVSPTLMTSCYSSLSAPRLTFVNPSTTVLDSIPVAYVLGSGAVVRDTVAVNLMPYGDTTLTLSTGLNWTGTSSQLLRAWTELDGDLNGLNDTLELVIPYLTSTAASLTFTEDFEGFSNCGTVTNCGLTTCALSGGWTNVSNGSGDDIDWRTNFGTTASSFTGPNAGFGGSGKYLYLEASQCDGKEAVLYSPCVDLSSAIQPELSFAYHMYGTQMGDLDISIFDGSSWTILWSKSGDQGNSWKTENIDLTSFAGKTVILRFRGITGGGYLSDMALDAVRIEDQIGAPEVDFSVSNTSPCLGTAVDLTDISAKTPTAWNWSISPATYSFVGGTDSTSQNPQISFSAYGSYTITLVASNSYGADSLVKSNIVSVVPTPTLPFVETWFGGSVTDQFALENPDGQTTWTLGQVVNATGAKSDVAYMNFFNYNNPGAEDALQSPALNIAGYIRPTLFFDISYAQYPGYDDELRVEISDDCGNTYATLYNLSGAALATAPSSTSIFIPSQASEWRTDSVDLSNLNGNQISVRFVSTSGYGNNLYIDNVRIIDAGATETAATAYFPNFICEDHPFEFGLNTTDTTLEALFVLNRVGSSIFNKYDGYGAHSATLNLPVPYTMEYVYFDGNTFVTDTVNLVPSDQFDPDFTLSYNGNLTYTFFDNSTPMPTSWSWDFGDGTTSTLQNPSHTYAAAGSYTVSLTVVTACGEKSTSTAFNNIDIDEAAEGNWALYPNPTTDKITVVSPVNQVVQFALYNTQGQLVEQMEFAPSAHGHSIDMRHLPKGVYSMKMTWTGGSHVRQVVVQ
ncbi:MAG: hypothetical protein RL754_324 [Bacteroidota bacterium]